MIERVLKWSGILTVAALVVAGLSLVGYWVVDEMVDVRTGLPQYPGIHAVLRTLLIVGPLLGLVSFVVFLVAKLLQEAKRPP